MFHMSIFSGIRALSLTNYTPHASIKSCDHSVVAISKTLSAMRSPKRLAKQMKALSGHNGSVQTFRPRRNTSHVYQATMITNTKRLSTIRAHNAAIRTAARVWRCSHNSIISIAARRNVGLLYVLAVVRVLRQMWLAHHRRSHSAWVQIDESLGGVDAAIVVVARLPCCGRSANKGTKYTMAVAVDVASGVGRSGRSTRRRTGGARRRGRGSPCRKGCLGPCRRCCSGSRLSGCLRPCRRCYSGSRLSGCRCYRPLSVWCRRGDSCETSRGCCFR